MFLYGCTLCWGRERSRSLAVHGGCNNGGERREIIRISHRRFQNYGQGHGFQMTPFQFTLRKYHVHEHCFRACYHYYMCILAWKLCEQYGFIAVNGRCLSTSCLRMQTESGSKSTEWVPPPAPRQGIPIQPWEVLQIDTLELGVHHGNRHHCVLVCITFTRWAEVCRCHITMQKLLWLP